MKPVFVARLLAAKSLLSGSIVLSIFTAPASGLAGFRPPIRSEVSVGDTAPTVTEIRDVTIETNGHVELFCEVDDDQTNPTSLDVTWSSSNPEVIPDTDVVIGNPLDTGGGRRIDVYAGANTGTTEITVTVEDSDGNSRSMKFVVKVVPRGVSTLDLANTTNNFFYAPMFDKPTSGAPFPVTALSKAGLSALNIVGTDIVIANDIRNLSCLSHVVRINTASGPAMQADVALRLDIGGTVVQTAVNAGTLFHFTTDQSLGQFIVPVIIPEGPDLLEPVREPGSYFSEIARKTRQLRYASQAGRAAWAFHRDFLAGAPAEAKNGIGLLLHDSAANVVSEGDAVPARPAPTPSGVGTTFTDFSGFSLAVNENYVAFKAVGDAFSGVYTKRFSDGQLFTVFENLPLDPNNFGDIEGVFLHGDRDVIVGTASGIVQGDVEGAAAPEIIFPEGAGGLLHDVVGDQAVIAGTDGSGLSTIFLFNLLDHSVQEVAKQGDEIPGGGNFGFVQRPAVSDQMVVFEGFDENLKFLGLFARILATDEMMSIVRVGDTIDGRVVQTIGSEPGALSGSVMGFVAYFEDGSSEAIAAALDVPISVPFLNISTRARVETGDNVLIAGFIITSAAAGNAKTPASVEAKKVIVRAIGPSLGGAGVPEALEDPVLEVHLPDGSLLTNDNWRDDQEQEIIDTAIPPNDDLESAIVATLEPGAYTAVVRGKNGGTGVGLVEVYDLDGGEVAEQANLSTRSLVQTGDNLLIGGLIVGGEADTASTVVVRAIGPSLAGLNVANPLEDPILELHDLFGRLLATNDDWKDAQQSEIEAAGLAPTDDRESAIVTVLFPGAYTAIVRGKDDTTGVALVEGYNLEAAGSVAARPVGLGIRR